MAGISDEMRVVSILMGTEKPKQQTEEPAGLGEHKLGPARQPSSKDGIEGATTEGRFSEPAADVLGVKADRQSCWKLDGGGVCVPGQDCIKLLIGKQLTGEAAAIKW